MSDSTYRIGVDVGGTFTDVQLIDETTGEIKTGKVLSTPKDPQHGFLDALDRILEDCGAPLAAVSLVCHASTVATNALLEGKGAKTGFITTAGFRDMLEIQRQIRPTLYDIDFDKPPALVPRYMAAEVKERIDAYGTILIPLDEESVRHAAHSLTDQGVESIAVCLLHGYAYNAHEDMIAKIIRSDFPEISVSISSELTPEFREYFRASTTVINAIVQPVVKRYLQGISAELTVRGFQRDVLVMQSNGGVLSLDIAAERPVTMIESGPAAGVIAAAHLSSIIGNPNVMSFDMGGTTAKTSLVQDGLPAITKEYEVGARAGSNIGEGRGSGYPLRIPTLDLVEIGAGGGSIAWIDSGGLLRVGPHSSGADPGPACYGRGGVEATVTDANLVLGRLNPAYFLGGEMTLDEKAAVHAVEALASKLSMDAVEAAYGIVAIANNAMANGLRLVSIQRGYDPSEFALVAFGGGGPAHADALGRDVGAMETIIPRSPGTFSANGLLVSDLRHEYTRTYLRDLGQLDLDQVSASFEAMINEGRETLRREGMRDDQIAVLRQFEMRYVGQSFELTVDLGEATIDEQSITAASSDFHREHARAYGYSAPSEPTEVVNLRLTATGQIVKPSAHPIANMDGESVADYIKGHRHVYFQSTGYLLCPIYDRYRIRSGATFAGPAVVEERDASTVVEPGSNVLVDKFGNLHIR